MTYLEIRLPCCAVSEALCASLLWFLRRHVSFRTASCLHSALWMWTPGFLLSLQGLLCSKVQLQAIESHLLSHCWEKPSLPLVIILPVDVSTPAVLSLVLQWEDAPVHWYLLGLVMSRFTPTSSPIPRRALFVCLFLLKKLNFLVMDYFRIGLQNSTWVMFVI